jgi:hypothetical protein
MKRSRAILIALVLITAAPAPAAKYATLVGGSSDDPSERPAFRKNFDTLNRGLLARGWETQVLFSDGDPKMPAREASRELIQTAVDDIAEKAGRGDQVLYFFCGHGTPRQDRRGGRGRPGEASHALQIQGGFFSLDNLREDLRTLHDKGARVAVVDLSCFSGATQATDFTSRATVVTLAATRYVSQCGTYDRTGIFTQKFVKLPRAEKEISLLDQFLSARVADPESANFAQISCVPAPATAAWQSLWYATDPANERRPDSFDGRPPGTTRRARQGTTIKESRDKITAAYAQIVAAAASPEQKAELGGLADDLEKKLDAYLTEQAELERVVADVRGKLARQLDWGFADGAARFNREPLVDMMEMIRQAKDGVVPDHYHGRGSRNRALYAEVLKDSDRLSTRLDEILKELGDAWPRYEKLSARLNERGEDVMKVERKLYDLYVRSLPRDETDTCRAFKF